MAMAWMLGIFYGCGMLLAKNEWLAKRTTHVNEGLRKQRCPAAPPRCNGCNMKLRELQGYCRVTLAAAAHHKQHQQQVQAKAKQAEKGGHTQLA